MSQRCFIGVDTSNYTTSVAVCSDSGEIVANLKAPLPVKAGECGLRQSDAVFAHVKNIPTLMPALREALRGYEVEAVGCSVTPRDAEGSYMPCFLAGRAVAEAIAAVLDLPLVETSHQDGHIMAALYSSGQADALMQAPFAAFHVSGGTTEMLYVQPKDGAFDVTLIGETEDLNAGQAIDRVGVMMGLDFPCGRALEALAAEYTGKLQKPRVTVKEGRCNLSGLQNLCEKLWRETQDAPQVSAYALAFIGETLKRMTDHIDNAYSPELPIIYAGGVMSNRYLQSLLGKRKNTYFAEPQFSADNAAGVALLSYRRATCGGANLPLRGGRPRPLSCTAYAGIRF